MIYRKILVTGGAGCIGMEVCKHLLEHDQKVEIKLFDLFEQVDRVKNYLDDRLTLCYGSILDTASLSEAIKDVDVVIHLGAYLGVKRTETDPLKCLDININGTKNVLDVSVMHNVKKFVFASSSEVYGEPINNPVRESDILQGKTLYAVSKMAGEEYVKAYSKDFNFNYTILRYFNTYGSFQTAQFVLPKFIDNVQNNKSPIIYGNGKQIRSFCHASDTAKATVESVFNANARNQIYNVGNPNSRITLNELADLVLELSGKKEKITIDRKNSFSDTDRSEDREINFRFCDISKIQADLGYEPTISVEEGIKLILNEGIIFPKWPTLERNYSVKNEQ